ncbi:digalactosyldiacylglycerol synthase 2 [Datura stramonium]|uniref:Digalactosyldiacylglycerol synthase 2 n=1 Tax=Datura stramonium TaxID=4076 RepID=A0ABS8UW97_DATST|nr:digalactosyldiacylglycerol synthase 2 [Datura stramonium]
MKVTLVVPWLPLIDQEHLFPNNITFDSHLEQEKYVRQWVEERTGFVLNFNMRFYPGKFSLDKRSILALGDITVIIPDDEADIAVLEEPEHLTCTPDKVHQWLGSRYIFAARSSGYLLRPRIYQDSWSAMCMELIQRYKELLDLYDHQKELPGFEIDLYGSGEDSAEIEVAAKKLELTVRVHPGRIMQILFHDYIFSLIQQPSASESSRAGYLPTKKQLLLPLLLQSLSCITELDQKLEDASALVHFVGTGFLSSQPDEEQCKELGLKVPPKKTGFSSGKWI